MDSSISASPNNKKGFYTITTTKEQTTSTKPIHLEERFSSKKKRNLNEVLNKQAVEIKREAILQERKNRLNQNFQKVARIAKEMKDRRENKINLLSKSMELAEANRNQQIEKRRAVSKQTVERAKNVVRLNQYKSQLEQERRRAELESRFEKTEQRRLAHLNNRYKKEQKQKKINSCSSPKTSVTPTKVSKTPTTSVTNSPTLLISPMSSVTLIEQQQQQGQQQTETAPKVKKPSSWSIILKAFRDLGLPLPSKPETWLEFNSLGKLLHQAKVIVVTTKVLNTALKLNDEESRQRARVLLTSYMTLMCPKEVLQDVEGVEEKRLHLSAKQMLQLFETWLKAHGRPGATAARLAFVHAWNEYTVLFEAWKSRDCNQLIHNMTAYYVELSTLRQTMMAQQNGDTTSVGDQLGQQLEQIKRKLEKLGGSEALAGLQRALELSSASTSTGRKRQQQNNTPRSPQVPDQQPEEAYAANGEQLGQLLHGYAPESGLTNEQLAHELIMDPEFKLTRQEGSDLEKRVREMAEKAYFDKVAQDLEKGTPELSLPSLIADVKARLLSLVRPSTSMYTSIDEAMDLHLIDQQLRQHTFDIGSMMNYVLNLMSNMCAPVRDVEIQAIRALPSNLVDQIQRVLHLLEDMGLDLANFRLRSLRPHLMSMAVEYEREKFAEMLMNGKIQLVRTTSWLTDTTKQLCQVAAQRNPEGIQPQKNNKPKHDSIFEEAFVGLLTQPQVIDSIEVLPETLAMDAKRMADYQNQVQAITIVSALLMLARNFGSATSHQLGDLATKLFTMLQDPSTSIDNLATEIERAVNVRPERREMICSMVDKTVSHTDTVYSLLLRRVASIIKSTLQNNTFVADAVLTSNGLQHVRSHLQGVTHQILRMIHHHRKVYASYYDEIIKKALNDAVSSSSSSSTA